MLVSLQPAHIGVYQLQLSTLDHIIGAMPTNLHVCEILIRVKSTVKGTLYPSGCGWAYMYMLQQIMKWIRPPGTDL